MAEPISFGGLDFKIVASIDETHSRPEDEIRSKPEPETPFRICIMGDFSGRLNRGITDSPSVIKKRRPVAVDRDNIDDVMERMGVEVRLPVAGAGSPSMMFRFSELDDFHPDKIFERLEVFQTLKYTRKRLNDPRTFESAKKEVRSWAGGETAPERSERASEQPALRPTGSGQTPGSLLDQIIGQADGRHPDVSTLTEPSGWNAFLKDIVSPYLVPGDDPEQEELVAAVDASISGLMKAILHSPDFQAIEAAWRALRFLLYRAETDAQLKVYLLGISKAELADDLTGTEDLLKTSAYRVFVEQTVGTPGGEPWAVLAGNYTFDHTREDVEILGRMARIARLAGAPFICAAHPHILGCESLAVSPHPDDWKRSVDAEDAQVWKMLRGLPEARYLGLILPRFLLRLPYGEDTDSVDYFAFEEMVGVPMHEDYLWGNPCFACALLIAQAFSHYGWDLRPGAIQDIGGLPLHVYKEQGESVIKPCAEVVFTEKAIEEILELGLMPLVSLKDKDTIRLVRFQSVADPLTQLAGPWVDSW